MRWSRARRLLSIAEEMGTRLFETGSSVDRIVLASPRPRRRGRASLVNGLVWVISLAREIVEGTASAIMNTLCHQVGAIHDVKGHSASFAKLLLETHVGNSHLRRLVLALFALLATYAVPALTKTEIERAMFVICILNTLFPSISAMHPYEYCDGHQNGNADRTFRKEKRREIYVS